MPRRTILSIAVSGLVVAATAAVVIQERREARLPESGEPIVFRAIESARDRAIIQDIVQRAQYDFTVKGYPDLLERSELRISEQDINQDGTPEYWVMKTDKSSCNEYGCATQLFWLFNDRWQRPVKYMIREGKAWGAKRPGFRDYVIVTDNGRDIFPFYEGRDIEARPLRTEEERAVAIEHLARGIDMSLVKEFPGWPAAIDEGRVTIAEADLDDDGQNERFIITNGYGLCGTIGCQALMLRKLNGTWQTASQLDLGEGFFLLDDKKFGWHRIYTGEEIETFKNGRFFETVVIDDAEIYRGWKFGPTP